MGYHFYADDTQLYLSFNSLSGDDQAYSVAQVESCVGDIDRWMSCNKLKLNRDKMELLVISSKYRPRSSLDSILVGDHRVNRSDKAWNIGIVLDETLSLDKHVNSVCKSALFHLWNVAKIRVYLSSESTKTLVHAYVTCRLDNCNSLLLGSPKYMIQKLQRVQNCPKRLVAGQPRAAHICPVRKELHWLPIEQRITLKVLLLTFKALNNLAPPYLSQLIVPYNPTRNLRSAGKHSLEVPNVRLKSYGDRAFSVAAPKHWNEIPLDIKLSRKQAILPVILVEILGFENVKRQGNLLLDSGAQVSFIKLSVADELGLKGKEVTITIAKVGGDEEEFLASEKRESAEEVARLTYSLALITQNCIQVRPGKLLTL
ncbi:uncharacterized protein [Montipora capricornis]|uniref:uncharacterized protein n=1 Tax=Montipora capricornis TaxID=246305 RepID=UPI0035F1B763